MFPLAVKLNKGRARRFTVIVDGTLVLLTIFNIAFMFIDDANFKKAQKEYYVYGHFLEGIDYESTVDGYYVFSKAQFMSPPSMYAAECGKVELPAITKIYHPVRLYLKPDGSMSAGEVFGLDKDNPGYAYKELDYDSLIKMTPDYSMLTFFAGLIAGVLMIVFSIVMTIRGLVTKNKE